jgi:hypothetical protein
MSDGDCFQLIQRSPLIHRFLLHVLEAGDFFEKMGRAHGKTMKGMNFMEFICDSKYIILPVSFL